jgi:hypothetical protein
MLAGYATSWYDVHTLLVGIETIQVLSDNPQVVREIALYDPSQKKMTILSTGFTATEWTINPISKTIAFRRESSDTGFEAKEASVEIVSLRSGVFVPISHEPPGCGLDWSPDGHFLFYTDRGPSPAKCYLPIQGFIFVDTTNGQIAKYPVGNNSIRMLLGWTSVPQ